MHDERLYTKVIQELNLRGPIPGLWEKAYAESNGSEPQAKALYVRYRIEQLAQAEPRILEQRSSLKIMIDILHNQIRTIEEIIENMGNNEEDKYRAEFSKTLMDTIYTLANYSGRSYVIEHSIKNLLNDLGVDDDNDVTYRALKDINQRLNIVYNKLGGQGKVSL
ncbi:MAG: hypothetical protein WA081_10470 [Desulfosalsimonadaceae bacterium]